MKRVCLADLCFEWDAGDVPLDPFEPVLPLALGEVGGDSGGAPPAHVAGAATVVLRGRAIDEPAPDPGASGAAPVLFHGKTQCYRADGGLVLWDGASLLRIGQGGTRIDAAVHPASLEHAFHFSSVTVMMALLLALREHGCFHLHAGGAGWPGGACWVVPGESGSGKSTLSLALFDAGARWLSDDVLLLRRGAGGPELLGWARKIRMTRDTAAAFPALSPLFERCPEGSARDFEVDPRRAFPGRGAARAPGEGGALTLLFPSIADGPDSRVATLDRARAFGRILHACAWVAAEHVPRRDEQLELLRALVDRAHCIDVAAGRRLLEEPRAAVADLQTRIAELLA